MGVVFACPPSITDKNEELFIRMLMIGWGTLVDWQTESGTTASEGDDELAHRFPSGLAVLIQAQWSSG